LEQAQVLVEFRSDPTVAAAAVRWSGVEMS